MITAEQIRNIQNEILIRKKKEKDAKKKVELILDKIEIFAKEYPDRHSIDFEYDNLSDFLDDKIVINELKNLGFTINCYDEESRNIGGYNTHWHKIVSW